MNLTRFKFFNGPHNGKIYSGHIVKPNKQWMLQLSDGTMIDLEFSIRLADDWKDVEVSTTSEEVITFVPVLNRKRRKLGKRFTRNVEDFT